MLGGLTFTLACTEAYADHHAASGPYVTEKHPLSLQP